MPSPEHLDDVSHDQYQALIHPLDQGYLGSLRSTILTLETMSRLCLLQTPQMLHYTIVSFWEGRHETKLDLAW